MVVIRIGAGESGEFLGLILPRAAIVAHEVFVFLELGIAVGREHLAVGVNVDPFALGLLQEFLEILQIVTRYRDCLALDRLDAHAGRDRVAVGISIRRIEHSHNLQVQIADLKAPRNKLIDSRRRIG